MCGVFYGIWLQLHRCSSLPLRASTPDHTPSLQERNQIKFPFVYTNSKRVMYPKIHNNCTLVSAASGGRRGKVKVRDGRVEAKEGLLFCLCPEVNSRRACCQRLGGGVGGCQEGFYCDTYQSLLKPCQLGSAWP